MVKAAPIEFSRAKTLRLQKAYKRAVELKQEQFTFDGNDYLTAYAKHLLGHLREAHGIEEE